MMEHFWNAQSLWIALGLVLLIAEVATSSLVFLFFGVAALITGVVTLIGLENTTFQILLFSVLSVVSMLLFRHRIKAALRNSKEFTNDTGEVILIEREVLPDETFEVSYQGTVWKAVNQSGRVLTPKDYAKIDRIDGVKLILK